MVKLKRAAPRKRHRRLLEAKMLAKIGVGTRVAEEAKAKAELLRKSVQAEQANRLSQEAESAQAAVVSQPDRHADLLPAAGGQAGATQAAPAGWPAAEREERQGKGRRRRAR